MAPRSIFAGACVGRETGANLWRHLTSFVRCSHRVNTRVFVVEFQASVNLLNSPFKSVMLFKRFVGCIYRSLRNCVRLRTFARSRVQTPLKSWLFQASIRNCLNCVHNCDDHGLLDNLPSSSFMRDFCSNYKKWVIWYNCEHYYCKYVFVLHKQAKGKRDANIALVNRQIFQSTCNKQSPTSVTMVLITFSTVSMRGAWREPEHRNTAKKINDHSITARKIDETPSPQQLFLAI